MKNKLIYWQDFNSIIKITESLKRGQVSIVSTDTVLGLLSDATPEAFEKLNEIKQRGAKSFIVLVDSIEKLAKFADFEHSDIKLFKLVKNCWPGPLTLIFKANKSLPVSLKSQQNSIAIRIPNEPNLLKLLANFDGLFSTSANISGQPVPDNIETLDQSIVDSVEYIVVDKDKSSYPVIPSTILDCTTENIKVIREGAYPLEKLKEYL